MVHYRIIFASLLSGIVVFSCACTNKISVPAPPPPVNQYTLDPSFGTNGYFSANAGPIRVDSNNTLWVGEPPSPSYNSLLQYLTDGTLMQAVTEVNAGTNYWPADTTVGVGFDGYVYVWENPSVLGFFVNGTTGVGSGGLTFAGDATGLNGDSAVGVAASNTYAYVLDSQNPRILLYNIAGTGASKTFTFNSVFGNTGSVSLTFPSNLILNSAGTTVYVADYNTSRIVEYGPTGNYLGAVTLTSVKPTDVAVDNSGNVFVGTDYTVHEVKEYNSNGAAITTFGGTLLTGTTGTALDSQGNLYVSNCCNGSPTFTNWGVFKFKKNW